MLDASNTICQMAESDAAVSTGKDRNFFVTSWDITYLPLGEEQSMSKNNKR